MRFSPLIRWLALAVILAPSLASASSLDALIADLAGNNEMARARARQLLPRESVEAVPKLLPLVRHENQAVWRAAFNVLADFCAEVSVPGREAERAEVTRHLMTLVAKDQPAAIKDRGLRLLPRVIPAGYDVGPIAALLTDSDPIIREKARTALLEAGTPEAAAALRAHLPDADPAFQCAILNALGKLRDKVSLKLIETLTESPNAHVRVAAARALAWTGDPFRLARVKAVLSAADADTHRDATDALIRLVNAIEENGGNWEIAVACYRDMLADADPAVKDAGLAGLGRIGDGTCVPPVLAAVRAADAPTRLVGLDALRRMQGVDVARALVTAYPDQPRDLQVALLEALGTKRHPVVLPILTEAAKSPDAGFRLAALNALAETELAEALPPLIQAALQSDPQIQPVARAGLIRAGDALQARGRKHEAGQAYLAVLKSAADDAERRRAIEGLAVCPIPDAFEAVRQAASNEGLQAPTARALIAIGKALTDADRKKDAVAAYELAGRLDNSPEMMKQIAVGMREAGAAADYAAMLGLLTRWWIVGPFELGENNTGWDKAWIGEPDVSLTARYMAGKRRVDWQPVSTVDDRGVINLHKVLGPGDNLIAYAYTEITVEKDTDAVLLFGADDSERVWVNGQKVFEHFVARPLVPDQDHIPIKLRAGKNVIVAKIWQNSQGWAFCARLTAPDGRPLVFEEK